MKAGQLMPPEQKAHLREKTQEFHADPERRQAFVNAVYRSKARELESEWADFVDWCQQNDAVPLPASPDAVRRYAEERLGVFVVQSVRRRLVAIRAFHALSGLENPTARLRIRGGKVTASGD